MMRPQFIPPAQQEAIRSASTSLHGGRKIEAANIIIEYTESIQKQSIKRVRNEGGATEVLLATLKHCLDTDNYELAAGMLWSPYMFTAAPWATRVVWEAIRQHPQLLLMGASSMSKTFGCGVFYYLDWLRDPLHTTIRVVGPSEDHLESNLFSHLVTLHRAAVLPVPGEIGALFIGIDPRDKKSAIRGMTIPLGKNAGAGRLQGVKRYPREQPHPVFGRMFRLRVLIDEIEKVPDGIWKDFRNLSSNIGSYTDGLKIVGAFNPEMTGSLTCQHAEPPGGWAGVDVDKDIEWESKKGWHVLRLDAHRCENVIHKEEIYPGLQTSAGLDLLSKGSGGMDSAGYWTFGRAMYPTQGSSLSIVTPTMFREARGQYLWYEPPQGIGAVDSALEGTDPPVFAFGRFGMATGIKYPPDTRFPQGRTIMFRQSNGRPQIRPALQVSKMFTLENCNTVKMADQIRVLANALGLTPADMMLDRTGNGAGVHDLLKELWGPEIYGLNYSESSSITKIMEQDEKNCDELYDRVHTELWYAFRRWLEFSFILFASDIEGYDTMQTQFTSRMSKTVAKGKKKVESKQDYKLRSGGQSPNEADAVTLLLHLVRKRWAIIPSMDTERATISAEEADLIGQRTMPVIVSHSDTLDDLEVVQGDGPYERELDWMS